LLAELRPTPSDQNCDRWFPIPAKSTKSVKLPNKDKEEEEFFLIFIIKHYAMNKHRRVVAYLHAGLIPTLNGDE
jgi:hypothetical protein